MLRARSTASLGLSLLGVLFACARAAVPDAPPSAEAAVQRRVMLLGETRAPVFFLGAGPDAPAVGFGSPDTKLILRGPAEQGRVPVRVHGRLTFEAYVPENLLELRAQRTEAVRGAPVLVGPGDRVRVLGPDAEPGMLRVSVQPRLDGQALGPFEGKLPAASLAANDPPPEAPTPEPGIAYRVPGGTPLPLYDAPEGELVTLVAPSLTVRMVAVTQVQNTWFAVRAGEGPYLVGYTNQPLTLSGKPHASTRKASTVPAAAVPERIARFGGALKRLAQGSKLNFRGQLLATLRSPGWARVIAQYPDGFSEVLAAADDQVAVRGLVRTDDLTDPAPSEAPPEQAAQDLGELELSPAR